METLAISLSIYVAMGACTAYALLLAKVVGRFARLRVALVVAGLAVLCVSVIEILLLAVLGAVASRALVGQVFYPVHLALFFLGPPALVNVLVLRDQPGVVGRWFVAGPIAAAYAFILVLLQYSVTESLYGLDGNTGPYSPQF